ncbi:MAG: signal peptidase I [Actinomycetota bacterium]
MKIVALPPATGRAGRAHPRGHGRLSIGLHRSLVGLGVVALLALAAVSVGPRLLPYRVAYVRSGSMGAAIPVGALAVFATEPAAHLHRGDVIAFTRPGTTSQLVTHRIAAVRHRDGQRQFVTKGDTNAAVDPWRIPAVGTGSRLMFSVPWAGYALAVVAWRVTRLVLLAGVIALLAWWVLAPHRHRPAATPTSPTS